MKKLLSLIAIIFALNANAQNYLISFTGTGASTTISTVKVENLTTAASLSLNGGDILRLNVVTGIHSIENRPSSELKIYPNPMTGNSILQVFPPEAGNAVITIFDMTGKLVAQVQSYLENNPQDFRLSGINSGFYLISVKGNTYQYSGKLLCNGKAEGTISIDRIGNNQAVDEKLSKKDSKGAQATVEMAYSIGDRLKFTGVSGIYSTVKTDIFTQDKTITFNFVACTDGDNNNYPVVAIGTQVWMAENLKTTNYNDGTPIPLVTLNTEWGSLITGAYCWYNNLATYKDTYGALYKGYTVSTGLLCPTGWHAPTDAEWTTLTTYLGGESVSGGKLKEKGTTHWTLPNTGATNETGFTALPAGTRDIGGVFTRLTSNGFWWGSTEYRDVEYNLTNVIRATSNKNNGFSVRCIKN
jgi:uncharacterized protein (TIGR02145 family)